MTPEVEAAMRELMWRCSQCNGVGRLQGCVEPGCEAHACLACNEKGLVFLRPAQVLADEIARLEAANEKFVEIGGALEAEVVKLQDIIDKHNLCHDQHGKVGQPQFEEGCRRETVKEFGSCGWADRIAELEAEVVRLKQGLREQGVALSRIDYLCGEPNDMECSLFVVDCNEERVVRVVEQRLAEVAKLKTIIANDCENEEEARKIAATVLGEERAGGDQYGVPGVADLMEMLVAEVVRLKAARLKAARRVSCLVRPGIDCPKCGSHHCHFRRGVHFEHMRRCPECSISWEDMEQWKQYRKAEIDRLAGEGKT